MNSRLRRSALALVFVSTLGLALTGCAGGQAPGGSGSPGSGGPSADGSFGTVTIDGEVFEVSDVYCGQVPVEDNAWRVIATFDNGELTINEDSGGEVVIDEERTWNVSSGSDNTRIDVGEHGATGETTVYHTEDTNHLVQLEAEVSC